MSFYRIPESCLKGQLKSLTPPYVFLETAFLNRENNTSFLFRDFTDILIFNSSDNPDLFFTRAENYLKRGFWLCGYFAYEAGYFLEPALYRLRQKYNFPLAWLGVCAKPLEIKHNRVHNVLWDNKLGKRILASPNGLNLKDIRANISRRNYCRQIKNIRRYLEEGFTYQVNFTFKIKFDFQGEPSELYLNLRRSQPTAYAALIDTGRRQILSFSPELFFRSQNGKIISRPMKGTAQRSFLPGADRQSRRNLRTSRKVKAENLMIVDLLRNDLGRISQKVRVPRLFEIEAYRTLHQMTSTIEAENKAGLKLKDIFTSLFPCGSVTGAPKIKTMEIIKRLEKEPRGVYTGAIGYISPARKMCFNVAIRTIDICQGKGELGVGGGIVYDSVDKDEYAEALLKARFFTDRLFKVSLIETILLDGCNYFLLDLHLKRMQRSARYFSIPFDIKKLRDRLDKIAASSRSLFKIRVVLSPRGRWRIEKRPLDKLPFPVKIKVSSQAVNPADGFLYHKTTRRRFYDRQRKKAQAAGCFEVIFSNLYGEITEGTISNVFILKDGQLYTPSLKCGLLPGVFREHLIREGKAKEKVLTSADLHTAAKVYIGNSVRGLIEAKIRV